MTLTNHAKYSTGAALVLLPFLRRRTLWFWLAAIFVDLDHLPGMVRRCGLNPLALIRFAVSFRIPAGRDPIGMRMSRPLHHPALAAGAFALAAKYPAALGVGLGLAFHLLLDRKDHHLGLSHSQAVTGRETHRCQSCGRYDTLLQAHHRDARRCPPQHAVPLDSLIGLCDRCHAVAHVDRA